MRLLVCVKPVPHVASLRLDPVTKRLQREGVALEVNSFDARALNYAVTLRAGGVASEVVAVTLGPPTARVALEHCLALGADRAIHVCDPVFAGSDVLATAHALHPIVRQERPDVILCGRYSVDAETAQLGPELATLLGVPCYAQVQRMSIAPTERLVFDLECETDDGILILRVTPPFLITVTEGIAAERFPSREELEQARSKPLVTFDANMAGVDPKKVGAAGSPTQVRELIDLPTQRLQKTIAAPSLNDGVRELAGILIRDCGLFGSWKVPSPPPLAPIPPRAVPQLHGRALVVADPSHDGGIRVTRELVNRARQLADSLGGAVGLVIADWASSDPSDWGRDGVDVLFAYSFSTATESKIIWPQDLAAAVSETIDTWEPEIVLFPSTWLGRNAAAVVAAEKELGLSADCIDLGLGDNGQLLQYKPAFGGTIAALITCRTRPAMATVRPGVFPLPDGRSETRCEVQRKTLARAAAPKAEALAYREIPQAGSALDEAEVVVGVGKGVAPEDLELLRTFAALLGAPLCTTRDVADEGWLPRHVQVGLTGRSIAPRLYIAVGIRGAFEHNVGFRRAGVVVAINRNARAPIFRHCDYGLVADYREAIPLLHAALVEVRAENGQ